MLASSLPYFHTSSSRLGAGPPVSVGPWQPAQNSATSFSGARGWAADAIRGRNAAAKPHDAITRDEKQGMGGPHVNERRPVIQIRFCRTELTVLETIRGAAGDSRHACLNRRIEVAKVGAA
jgi:hypothetical protein